MAETKPTVICVYDPLCGWCYGFGPVFSRLQNEFSDRLDFDIFSAGMITGERVGPLSNMASFIKASYKQVENVTGVKFGDRFVSDTLEKGTAIYSSLEPSKMLTIFRRFHPKKVIEFSHRIQQLIYVDGINPIDYEAYYPLFQEYGIAKTEIEPLLKVKEIELQTINEFGKAEQWGISSYPTTVLQAPEGKTFGVSRGYRTFEDMTQILESMLGQKM